MKKFLCLALILFPLLISCEKKDSKPLVLWTDCVEFVSYVEAFNAAQDEVKIVALYKDAVETALPPEKGAQKPDIVAGTFLQSGMEKKYFVRLDSLFKKIDKESFYPVLLEAGQFNQKQYLLPVSFNLPALVFSTNNYDKVKEETISFESLKNIATEFNSQNRDGSYKTMGFGPHWNPNFIYLVLKTNGITYSTENNQLAYTEYAFDSTLASAKNWSEESNGSVQDEQDFAFKYLYAPFYEHIKNERCLFSYATSDQIINLSNDKLEDIDFRWICNNGKIQIEDDIVMIGIYSASKNKAAAKKFLQWFLNEESQRFILERNFGMKLHTQTFGIAGGFSSIQNVNKNIFPSYYRPLLSNLPASESLAAPQIFPKDWEAIKNEILIPYISAVAEDSGREVKPLATRYAEYISAKDSF